MTASILERGCRGSFPTKNRTNPVGSVGKRLCRCGLSETHDVRGKDNAWVAHDRVNRRRFLIEHVETDPGKASSNQ